MAQCEVCGRPLHNPPTSVEIDGAKFRVCSTCARLGRPVAATKLAPPAEAGASPVIGMPPPPRTRPPSAAFPGSDWELRQDFHHVIKEAREKLGLSQEELGYKLNEKLSVIKLVESGKLKPDNILARKFEHYLKVELMASAETEA